MDKFLSKCYDVLYRSIVVRKPIVLYFWGDFMRRIMVTIVALVLFFQQVYSTNVKAEGNEALVTAEDAVQLVQNVTSYKLEKQDIDKEGQSVQIVLILKKN